MLRAVCAGFLVPAALFTLSIPAHAFQARFRVGDRVLCQVSGVGEWLPGTVAPYEQRDLDLEPDVPRTGRFYRVRLDHRPANWQPDTCLQAYTRLIGGGSAPPPSAQSRRAGPSVRPAPPRLAQPPAPPRYSEQQRPQPVRPQPLAPRAAPITQPPAAGGSAPRTLRGTAWKIESRGSIGVQVFLFCNSGRWEIVGSQLFNGGVSPVGTYTQWGSRLTTRNQDDGMVTNWSLAWPGGDRLDLNDGRVTLRLRYNGRASC